MTAIQYYERVKWLREHEGYCFEQDTIEQLIMPLLCGVIGELPKEWFWCNGNRAGRGANQFFDVNLFSQSRTLLLGVECKPFKEQFNIPHTAIINDKWVLGAAIKEKPIALSSLLHEKSEDAEPHSSWRTMIHNIGNAFSILTEAQRKQIVGNFSRNINKQNDHLWQMWRYGVDKRHHVGLDTKIVWTNGIEWIVFFKKFFTEDSFSSVPVKNGMVDWQAAGDLMKYLRFPDSVPPGLNLEDMAKTCAEWDVVHAELKGAIL